MSWKDWLLTIVLLSLIIGGPIMGYLWARGNWLGSRNELTITCKEKWIKSKPNADTQIYMFADMQGNVYQITDDWFNWRFDSSDRYASLTAGQPYKIVTFGWREPYWSWYPNAVFIEPFD